VNLIVISISKSIYVCSVLTFLYAPIVEAADACKRYSGIIDPSARNCECGKDLGGRYTVGASDAITMPGENPSLVAVCGFQKGADGGSYGLFYFKGNVEISGTLYRTSTSSIGEYTEFVADVDTLPTGRIFKVAERGKRPLLPPLGGNVECRKAQATLQIRGFEYADTGGSDNDGAYLLDFGVISKGKVQACRSDEAP